MPRGGKLKPRDCYSTSGKTKFALSAAPPCHGGGDVVSRCRAWQSRGAGGRILLAYVGWLGVVSLALSGCRCRRACRAPCRAARRVSVGLSRIPVSGLTALLYIDQPPVSTLFVNFFRNIDSSLRNALIITCLRLYFSVFCWTPKGSTRWTLYIYARTHTHTHTHTHTILYALFPLCQHKKLNNMLTVS